MYKITCPLLIWNCILIFHWSSGTNYSKWSLDGRAGMVQWWFSFSLWGFFSSVLSFSSLGYWFSSLLQWVFSRFLSFLPWQKPTLLKFPIWSGTSGWWDLSVRCATDISFIYKENVHLFRHWGLETSHVTLRRVLFLLCMPLLTFSHTPQGLIFTLINLQDQSTLSVKVVITLLIQSVILICVK